MREISAGGSIESLLMLSISRVKNPEFLNSVVTILLMLGGSIRLTRSLRSWFPADFCLYVFAEPTWLTSLA